MCVKHKWIKAFEDKIRGLEVKKCAFCCKTRKKRTRAS